MKTVPGLIISLILIIAILLLAIVYLNFNEQMISPVSKPAGEISTIKTQLEDVENKIQELPELEEDIFTKCMEGKEGTAKNLRDCGENTQKQIFTLSQELVNLKESLQERLRELQ